ncbi:MAG: EamA family transporter [Thermoproteus sp.]
MPGALAYTAWNTAVKRAGRRRIYIALMPVITLIISTALLGEYVSGAQALGMATAIGACT